MNDSTNDPEFEYAVDNELYDFRTDERVMFIDTDNKVREIVYANEFGGGVLQDVRERMEKTGQLKGIVHVSATVLGTRDGPGPRYTTIEYLPTQEYYVRRHVMQDAGWVTRPEVIESALESTRELFQAEEEAAVENETADES